MLVPETRFFTLSFWPRKQGEEKAKAWQRGFGDMKAKARFFFSEKIPEKISKFLFARISEKILKLRKMSKNRSGRIVQTEAHFSPFGKEVFYARKRRNKGETARLCRSHYA